MAKVISIFNQKGGVGKTTTNVNLCAALALRGERVLSIDIDPQGNSTSGFGINKNQLEYTLFHRLQLLCPDNIRQGRLCNRARFVSLAHPACV